MLAVLILLQLSAFISGSLGLISLYVLVVAFHLISKENVIIVIIVDSFFVIHVAARNHLRPLWHQTPTKLIGSVILVLVN